MIQAIVAGAGGRMGKRIIHMIQQSEEVRLAGAFEHPHHPAVGMDAGSVAGVGEVGVRIGDSLIKSIHGGDVIIDFTAPDSTMAHLREAASRGISMVIGTTGISGENLAEVERLTKKISCVMAPNMSVGMNVMFRIAGEMAHILGDDYDIELLEIHHRFKKDAPSGTALRLAEILSSSRKRNLHDVAVYDRKGLTGPRKDHEIGIQALRAGDITGEHTVMFGGIGERLELVHRAHNRDNFARGAVRAATWVVKQPAGLYDMQHVLGLR